MYDFSETLFRAYSGDLTAFGQIVYRCRLHHPAKLAEYCMISTETARRWLRTGKPNKAALKLLAVKAGYLPWSGWKNWEMDNGYLFQPGFTRYGIESGDIVALPFTMQLQSEYKKMIREKDAQIEALEAELKRFKEKPKAKVYLLKNHLL